VPTPRAEALVAYLLSLKDTYGFPRRNPMSEKNRGSQMSAVPPTMHRWNRRASDEQLQEVHAILLREKPEPTEGYSPLPLMVLA